MPNPGLPKIASIGGAGTIRTFDQSASSSSAMINGSEVIDPCPISVAADMMVIVPSGVIDTHGLSALRARSGASPAATAEPLFPNATAMAGGKDFIAMLGADL